MNFSELGRFLLIAGLSLACVGAILLLAQRIPFLGRLPGDLHITRNGMNIHIPIVTCLLASVILTLIFNLFIRK